MYPSTYSPYFGLEPEIQSITLTLPYFSTAIEINEEGATTYELDSVYGDAPIKLSVYENTYYLRNTDPSSDFDQSQLYYSNANETINFDNFKGELLYSTTDFTPSNEEIVITEFDEDTEEDVATTRLSPRLQVELLNTNNYWEKLLFEKEDSPELSNQNNFVDYFRGIYIKAEAIDDDGNQILINFDSADAEIVVKYNYISEYDTDTEDPEIFEGEYTLNFNTTRINLFESDINFSDGNMLTGDANLYLKGGEGSMAVVDLFHGPDEDGDGEADSYLDDFLVNKENWLINEAQLIVYEDGSQLNTADDNHTYDRLYAYDVKNNLTLIDYSYDQTTSTSEPLYSKISHLGQRLESDGNYKYKIRITEHVKNILKKDSTNTKIGLVLSTNVNNTLTADLLGSEGESVTGLPEGAILSPKGTVLHGSNSTVPENLRAKLKIYYTELEN